MRPAAAGPEDAGVAVLFSGWLGVTIPHRGAVTRAALVEPLGAHVFVAGAFMPDDCGPAKSAAWRGNATACAEALWDRLALLRPFEAVSLEPMPTVKWLHGQLATNPHWPAIRKAFRADLLFLNLSIFSPVLGSRNANVLRELVMYERVYKLVRQAELRRQRKYATLVFSRLEYQWLAPHPPLDAFASSEDIVWAPPPDANGMNDRHALLPRKAGPAYFQRWSSLLSPRIVRRFTLSELVALGPESFLRDSIIRGPEHDGHCGGTDQGEEGDCTHGSKGSLPFGPNSKPVWGMVIADEAACVRFCAERCARCRYVSISAKGSDCSWYNKCAFDALELEPRWLFHKSYDLGSVKGKAKPKGQAERKAAKLGIGSQA